MKNFTNCPSSTSVTVVNMSDITGGRQHLSDRCSVYQHTDYYLCIIPTPLNNRGLCAFILQIEFFFFTENIEKKLRLKIALGCVFT